MAGENGGRTCTTTPLGAPRLREGFLMPFYVVRKTVQLERSGSPGQMTVIGRPPCQGAALSLSSPRPAGLEECEEVSDDLCLCLGEACSHR